TPNRISAEDERSLICTYLQAEACVAQANAGEGLPGGQSLKVAQRLRREALAAIVDAQMPAIRAIASRSYSFLPAGLEPDDLINAGVEGLIAALPRFDPSKGTRLGTYASWWIRNKISAELR